MARARLSGSGYSVWFMPKLGTPGEEYFNSLIPRIATMTDSAAFPAHMTLLGSVQGDVSYVTSKAESLAQQIAAQTLDLVEIDSIPGILHRTLFIRAKKEPALMAASQLARSVFAVEKADYDPHVSLAYNDITATELTEIRSLALAERAKRADLKFEVDHIAVWRTEGLVNNWTKVVSFPLCPVAS